MKELVLNITKRLKRIRVWFYSFIIGCFTITLFVHIMFPSALVRIRYQSGSSKETILHGVGNPSRTLQESSGSEQLIYVRKSLFGSYQLIGNLRDDQLEKWTVEGL
jgi:hypothetical protein